MSIFGVLSRIINSECPLRNFIHFSSGQSATSLRTKILSEKPARFSKMSVSHFASISAAESDSGFPVPDKKPVSGLTA